MTRKKAIQIVASIIGLMPSLTAFAQRHLQDQPMLELDFGKPKPKPALPPGEATTWGFFGDTYEPGTGSATIHLARFDHIRITNGDREIIISRDEIWKALQ